MTATATSLTALALVVANPGSLIHGSKPRHSFDAAGGTIGGRGADWTLPDKSGRVDPIHSEIVYRDAAFCVVDRSGQTRVNDADAPLGKMVAAKLRDGDVLHIGPYHITVHLNHPHQELLDPARHLAQYGVGEILEGESSGHDDLPAGSYVFEQDAAPAPVDADFLALSTPFDARADSDPLRALDAAERAAASPPVVMEPWDVRRGGSAAPTQADLATTRFEAVTGSPVTGSPLPFPGEVSMPKSLHKPSPQPYRLNNRQAMVGDPTEAAELLMQGLEVPLGPLDAQAGQALLHEAGQALNAAIRGIARVYAEQSDAAQPRRLLGRSLQPIEDNPLRLGLSYPDTVRAMFATDRSVVHLSPKAAVDESLAQLHAHHGAVTLAIQAGLDAVLRSLAPALLLQRFNRYRPDQASDAGGGDGWAWGMYTHYYAELASTRQRGFEKLFWDVFEQAYDRVLRAEAE
ncbi:MAG: type VI secretion system-associated FHA domain protein TagH [Achromobacter sp.]|uniref:type VI secretion system-associated FHA domain protein TagH n=1 Tax=Achromobacter sp. TaxID=134375 RepID=UPI0029B17E70|nr:type VI secretion system-associated FHA domain protein TagH [Achromobacter sp.]MDX3985234.1 type VI secretion system-associated FHA domain protein TagH [Achromobacter sp.]